VVVVLTSACAPPVTVKYKRLNISRDGEDLSVSVLSKSHG